MAVGAALVSQAIDIAVGVFEQTAAGVLAVGAVERLYNGERFRGDGNFPDRAVAVGAALGDAEDVAGAVADDGLGRVFKDDGVEVGDGGCEIAGTKKPARFKMFDYCRSPGSFRRKHKCLPKQKGSRKT